MKTLRLGTLLAAAALLWPTVSAAKELSSLSVCGSSGCKTINDLHALHGMIRALEAQGEPVSVPTPSPAPFLRLEFFMRGDQQAGPTFRQYYVPSRGAMLVQTDPDAWAWVSAQELRSLIDRVAAGVKPYPRPAITAVTFGGKPLVDADEAAALFTVKPSSYTVPDEPDWVDVRIKTREPSPWSTTAATLAYSPSTRVLWRGSEFIKLPASLGSSSDGSFPWTLFLGGLGGAAVVVPTTLFVRRRRSSASLC